MAAQLISVHSITIRINAQNRLPFGRQIGVSIVIVQLETTSISIRVFSTARTTLFRAPEVAAINIRTDKTA